jgi:hypothetical protein
MPPDDNPPLPLLSEIPWTLHATTKHLGPSGQDLGPDTTVISLFSYIPSLDAIDKNYPDDTLIYLKFTVSVSPMFFLQGPPPPGDPLNLFSTDTQPVWRMLFDVRISPEPYIPGGITPYFLDASPIRRTVMETGVVGQQASEGESNSLAIGKSGSQMHEGYSSTVDTSTNSAGFSWAFGSVGSSDTSSNVSGSRDVVQHIDTTQRNASTERQELVSHMTNVNNVLTLLSAYGVGTPYLRFSLWPQPLRPLTIDPSDPNLWYAELLKRRSSGIEGIQEFFAIAVVPRTLTGFCIQAQLRRFSAIPPPLPDPKQFAMPNPYIPTAAQIAILVNYLTDRYPPGTPVDELDVELVPWLPNNPKINRPVIGQWMIRSFANGITDEFVIATTLDTIDEPTAGGGFAGIYKSAIEVWLDMKKDEYEKELVKSPLANGILFFKKLILTTCFGPPFFPLAVLASDVVSPSKPSFVDLNARPTGGSVRPSFGRFGTYQQAVLSWNAGESQLGTLISHAKQLPEKDLSLDHPKFVDFSLRRMAAVDVDDPTNRRLENATDLFALTAEQIQALHRSGISDVRSLAQAILDVPAVDRVNQRQPVPSTGAAAPVVPGGAAGIPVRRHPPLPPPPPLTTMLTAQLAQQLRLAFGNALRTRGEQNWGTQTDGT